MVKKKTKSKRQSLKQKYMVQKLSKEHKKKIKKGSKKVLVPKSKLKRDPGIPNLCPFKDKMLHQMEKSRQRDVEEKQARKEQLRKQRELLPKPEKTTESLQQVYRREKKERRACSSRQAYMSDLRRVVELADVIIEVLDCRDPMSCRCKEIEDKIIAASMAGHNKKLILVLNKIDLVPSQAVEAWLTYLKQFCPTVAFKASTQEQKTRISHASHAEIASRGNKTSKVVGADTLMQLLNNYSRRLKLKTAISVGVIGYPNVGKSSIINSLKRQSAVGVANSAGSTKHLQEVKLDKHIKLIDSPGVIFSGESSSDPEVQLRNCVRVENIADPIGTAAAIVNKCPPEALMQVFEIPDFQNNPQMFISLVAQRRGKLLKGGISDDITASRLIIQDWNSGKIPYFTTPPQQPHVEVSSEISIVNDWGKELDIDALLQTNETEAMQCGSTSQSFACKESGLGSIDPMFFNDIDMNSASDEDIEMDDN